MTNMVQSIRWQLPVLLLAWAVAFSPVVPPMVEAWLSHSDNSHALLVPLISLYFLWEKRAMMRRIPVQGSSLGFVLLVASLAIYLVSFVGGIAFFTRLMFVAALIGLLWSCLGTPMLRLLAFPLGFLFFMVPVPDTLLGLVSFPLQMAATKISAGLIQFCSIPVYREGNMLYFLQTQLEVAEACSGIRSIMSLTMLSVIFAYISPGNWWRKGILILSAIPIALLANILRVSGTGVLAHFFGDRVARGFLHEFSGMAVFMFGLMLLFFVYRVVKAGTRDAGRGTGDGQ
jgi:exosortase